MNRVFYVIIHFIPILITAQFPKAIDEPLRKKLGLSDNVSGFKEYFANPVTGDTMVDDNTKWEFEIEYRFDRKGNEIATTSRYRSHDSIFTFCFYDKNGNNILVIESGENDTLHKKEWYRYYYDKENKLICTKHFKRLYPWPHVGVSDSTCFFYEKGKLVKRCYMKLDSMKMDQAKITEITFYSPDDQYYCTTLFERKGAFESEVVRASDGKRIKWYGYYNLELSDSALMVYLKKYYLSDTAQEPGFKGILSLDIYKEENNIKKTFHYFQMKLDEIRIEYYNNCNDIVREKMNFVIKKPRKVLGDGSVSFFYTYDKYCNWTTKIVRYGGRKVGRSEYGDSARLRKFTYFKVSN